MIWSYNDEYRDEFSLGPHRDILIVPHATKVTPVPGGPPTITSRRPIFDWNSNTNKYEPRKSGNDFVLDDVEWTITNDDIVKEKFKYTYSLNSEQNLTFSSCNAAMIQFTIRNKKEYVEEEDDEGNGTGNWYWEQEIPNLYKKEYTKKDPDGTERIVTGEVLSHACIELYMYINGDSSTIQYMGMFTVEEDKLVDGGYNRQITAYDFLATFRDMDIFNWYKHLFSGINILDNDLEDAMNDSKEETSKPDNYDDKDNWVREKREKWTIGDAIKDLFTNIAAYDMATFETDAETGKKIMTKGATDGNPNDYGRDGYPEGNRYSGFGMPIKLDDDLFDKTKKYSIPDEPGSNKHECYGYMDILELEFYQNPKIMKAESLSFGKFLEDVGMLAGRYPYIRLDDLEENDYFDPNDQSHEGDHKYDSRYNNYERCILTFKPLPSSDRDSTVAKTPEMEFSNHEIAKGFQHEYWPTEDIAIFKIPLDDGTEITYKRLDKEQQVAESKSLLQTFTMPNNMFASYLVTKSDDDDVKKMLEKYKVIREDLFGKETKNGNMSAGAKFQPGYLNMKSRTYTPFQLTTYADTVRECGDRILINFQDKITGEITTFYSYILERSIEGIQKMMDTYTANGNVRNPIFANYQASLKSGSGDGNQNGQDLGLMTPYDLVEYMRNCGYRMLDEPTDCEAVFCKGGNITTGGEKYDYHQILATAGGYENEYAVVEFNYLIDNPNQNPIHIYISPDDRIGQPRIDAGTYEAKNFDMVYEYSSTTSVYAESQTIFIFYEGTWYPTHPSEDNLPSYINTVADIALVYPDQVKEGIGGFEAEEYDETENKFIYNDYYSAYSVLTINGTETQIHYGDNVNVSGTYISTFTPPGIWTNINNGSGGDFNAIALSDCICYHYIGLTEDNITDGSTTTSVYSINIQQTVTIKEYDMIRKVISGDTHTLIYYNNSWKDITARKRQIADISTKAKIEAIPEIAEIMLKGNPGQSGPWAEYSRLYGYDINVLTINGQTVNVEVFDTLKLPYSYLIYTPNNVWYSLSLIENYDAYYGDSNAYIPIRDGTSTVEKYVQLKWSDPPDITDWQPTPATWEGTVVIRKEDSAPLHRWDGEKVVNVTTRDKYKTKAYKDKDIKLNRTYYYCFMPYYTIDNSDPEHPIRAYTFTKTIKVETGDKSISSSIDKIEVSGNTATIYYTLNKPDVGQFTNIKIYGKIGSNPACDNTDDVVVEVDDFESSSKSISGLTTDTTYYFCLVTTDTNDEKLSSNVESCFVGTIIVLYSGSNKMTMAPGSTNLTFKIFSGENVICTFTSPNGMTDTSKVYVSFLIDPNHDIARPSLIYDNGGSTYNYNVETLTSSEEQAVYSWLGNNWG